jgi:hypothetical protein
VLRGHGLKRASKTARRAGNVVLTVKPTGKTASRLATAGRAKVTARITFTPTGGTSSTKSKKLTLLG